MFIARLSRFYMGWTPTEILQSPWRIVFSMWDNMWKLTNEEAMQQTAQNIVILDIAAAANAGGDAYKSLRAVLSRQLRKPDEAAKPEKKVSLAKRLVQMANSSPRTAGFVKVVNDGSVAARLEEQRRKHGASHD